MRWPGRFALIALLVAALGCEGATSGSTSGGREMCRGNNYAGVCEGSCRKMTGTVGHDIELEGLSEGAPVDVKVEVEVESGVLRFSVTDPNGNTISEDARPGMPATLIGTTGVDAFGEIEITFEAVEGEATGIEYEIAYQVRA